MKRTYTYLMATAIAGGVIAAVCVGTWNGLQDIRANLYISDGMFRLAAISLRARIQEAGLRAGALGLALGILVLAYRLGLAAAAKFARNRQAKPGPPGLLTASCVSLALFLGFGWVMNRYFLGHKFAWPSILADLGLTAALALLVITSVHPRPKLWTRLAGGTGWLRHLSLGVALAVAGLHAGLIADQRINAPSAPNVVVLLVDALRRDHLGCYGYERNTSPRIDGFAESATLFTAAFAQAPATKPSVASLFTSTHPSRHGAIDNYAVLDRSYITLAELLAANRYRTAGFTENPVIQRGFLYDQGFESWVADLTRVSPTTGKAEGFDRKILRWLRRNGEAPFFLYVHFLDPHSPYSPPAPYDGLFGADAASVPYADAPLSHTQYFAQNPRALADLISLYDSEIRFVDARVGQVLDELKRQDLLDKSIVIILSDHGEGFLEHGWLEHAYSVHGEVINIPLLIRYPGAFGPGREAAPAQHIDIMPTLMGLLNLGHARVNPEGRDLMQVRASASRGPVVSEHLREYGYPHQRALISGDSKLIRSIESGAVEFHRLDDELDTRNLAADCPEEAARLQAELDVLEKRLGDASVAPNADRDEEMEELLRTLGYL